MRRQELAHILRAAARISGDDQVLVIGSQSILGSFDEDELPDGAVASMEADIAFFVDPGNSKSDAVDGAIGEDSAFHQMYGHYAQGVDVGTAILPAGWRERVVAYSAAATGPAVGICLGRGLPPHQPQRRRVAHRDHPPTTKSCRSSSRRFASLLASRWAGVPSASHRSSTVRSSAVPGPRDWKPGRAPSRNR